MENRGPKYRVSWTAKELADAAGVSTPRIRQLLIEGTELRGYKRAGVWFVADSEAKRWLENRKD